MAWYLMKSPHLRTILLVLSLLLICGGLFAIGYALWPISNAQLTATLPPTLFAPP
jgi:hypothetical protein